MRFSSSSGDAPAIERASGKRSNSAGVVLFTRSSVHCADSTVAQISSNGFRKLSAMVASGCAAKSFFAIRRARFLRSVVDSRGIGGRFVTDGLRGKPPGVQTHASRRAHMVCKKPTPYSLLVTGTSLIALLLGSAFHDTALAAHDHHGANAGSKTPRKARSSVKHIVVVMMENRSFDHLLGWMPNADGNQNLAYPAEDGSMISTMPLAPDWQGCTHPDPDHSFDGARVEYDDGKMDGFLVAGANDEYAIGYYNEADRPFFNTFAQTFTTLDHFFAAHLGSTYPNRIFQHAAQTDRIENTLDISTLPTIWDRLAEAGISNRYYFSDVPFLLLWGAKYAPIFATHEQFLVD